MSDLDLQAIQERAERGHPETHSHACLRSRLAADVLALLADREEREQKLLDVVQRHSKLLDTAVGWRHQAVAAEADREAAREALDDQAEMADQSVEMLRDLHANWRRIVDEQDPDGGPLIENILYWLIEDVTPTEAREVLARLSSANQETP